MQGQLTKATQEWASLFTNLPWPRWWKAAPRWVTVLMVILVAKAAADLTWLLFAPDSQGQNSAVRGSVPAGGASGSSQPRLLSVASLHLFGVAPKETAAPRSAPIEAKETGLKLTLKGVFAANQPERAMALIADARGEEKVYKKNDVIFSGVKLYEVYPDRVILERSGNYEALYLPRDEAGRSAAGAPRVSRGPTPASRPVAQPPVRTRNIKAGKGIEELREQLSTNPQAFWQEVRIEPEYDENNQIKGYRFEHNDQALMRSMGLRPGDVIVEVNGQPLTDPSTLSGLFGTLSSATSISLGIERNGRREDLNINM